MNYGIGQTNGSSPVDSWLDSVGGTYVISNTYADSGTTSMRLDAFGGNTAFGYLLALPSSAQAGDTLWFSVRTYRPVGYSDSANPWLKFFRMHTFKSDGVSNGGYDDVYIFNDGTFHFIYEGAQIWEPGSDVSGWTGATPVIGAWETWDYAVTFDTTPKSQGGKAEVFFWKNKALVGHITDLATLAANNYKVSEIHHSSYWNGGAPQNQSLYVGRYAVAAKIVGLRDDTPFLTADSAGTPLIALGF
jgi:hypothetical protein